MDFPNISFKRNEETGLNWWPRAVEVQLEPAQYAVLYSDFDSMKTLLDTYGIPAGEAALSGIGAVLQGLTCRTKQAFVLAAMNF